MDNKTKVCKHSDGGLHLGLVCISFCKEIRYRTITRTRYMSLDEQSRRQALSEIYSSNIEVFDRALTFCKERDIRLYRMLSSIFPFADTTEGLKILEGNGHQLARLGERVNELGIRVVAHPDQFVVLSSDSRSVIENSISVLKMHADIFDFMGFSRSPFNAIIIHGGKRGNDKILIDTIKKLPESIRSRLTLENDELSYSASQILAVCNQTGLSMIFDAHHHLIKESCSDYNDPRIEEAMLAARSTWQPREDWQLVHISNGTSSMHDRRHNDFITVMPDCFSEVGWIEVEARAKEVAIDKIRSFWKPVSCSVRT